VSALSPQCVEGSGTCLTWLRHRSDSVHTVRRLCSSAGWQWLAAARAFAGAHLPNSTAQQCCCSSDPFGLDGPGTECPACLYLLCWLLAAGSCVILMTMLSRVPTAGVHDWRGVTMHACSRSMPSPTSAGVCTGCIAMPQQVMPCSVRIASVFASVSQEHSLQQHSTAQHSTARIGAHLTLALFAPSAC
jgi:hypothetical protein